MSRRGPKPASFVERLRTRYWYVQLMRRGLSKADMNRLLLEVHQDPGAAAFLPTFYRIANETRLAGEIDVYAIERRIAGSRVCYDALLWRVLMTPRATVAATSDTVELELERHGLRRASRGERLGHLGDSFGVPKHLLYWHYLRASAFSLPPLAALGIAALLYREADLAAQPDVQEEAMRVFDEIGDPLFCEMFGNQEGATIYTKLLGVVRHAARPAQGGVVGDFSWLINRPIAPSHWSADFVYGSISRGILEVYEDPRPVTQDAARERA